MTSLLEIAKDAPVVSIPKGDVLLQQGKVGNRIFILKQGAVHITRDGTSICTIKSPGSAFGEISTLLGIPSTATATATADSSFVVIDNPLDTLKQNPEFCLEIAKLLAHRLRWLTMTYSEEIDDGESVFWASR
ncbi:Crp/Fnr family transcriptional regulator [Haloferula sp. A504]|uniref:Crp/Fnr family transcriptional regulator n=1 Tax=Haloferula sp. A504 TaxID=3373601 RepID=UPI0031C93023|nr:Crp/Fnr family transcriptional regulator [Verrucomicrobiaceae bacterium E54]